MTAHIFGDVYGHMHLPLCTANVWPTNSGTIIERRDQVRMGRFSPDLFRRSTFSNRLASTYGPFLSDRGMSYFLRDTMNRPDLPCGCLVFIPLAYWPHGERGCPPVDLPSPPPMG